MLTFVEGRKPQNPDKTPSEQGQQTQPTYDTSSRISTQVWPHWCEARAITALLPLLPYPCVLWYFSHTIFKCSLTHYLFSRFNTLHWLTWLSPWQHTLLFMSTLMHWCQTVLLNTLWVLNHVIFIYRGTMWAPCGQPCECAITFIPVFPWTVTC